MKPKNGKKVEVIKVKRAPVKKRPKIDKGLMIYLMELKEYRRKNPSNYNDPKTASTYNLNIWPSGMPDGNYKPNVDDWLFSIEYGNQNFDMNKSEHKRKS